jgi:hypothetical protein
MDNLFVHSGHFGRSTFFVKSAKQNRSSQTMHRYASSMSGIVPFHRIRSWQVHPTRLPPPNQWLALHPPTALLKKHPSGSSHTNPLFTIMRWFTIVVTSTSPHTRIIRVTMLHFHVASNRTKFGWFGRPFWTHAYVDLLIHSQKKGKTRLVLLHRSTSQTNVATVSVARMKLMFVRWFGRPFWTHTDVHLLVYTYCSLDGSAVHFGLTPTSTHRFLVYIQRKTRLVLLHRSASQTNGSTVSDCPNETRVHHILFQCQ